jgi:hypothetical protein
LAVIVVSSFPVLAEYSAGTLKYKGLRLGERGGFYIDNKFLMQFCARREGGDPHTVDICTNMDVDELY